MNAKTVLVGIVTSVAAMVVYDWLKTRGILPSSRPAAPGGVYPWF